MKRSAHQQKDCAAESSGQEAPRYPGLGARSPRDMPRAGWKNILARVWARIGENNLGLVAAGVAFYGLLALFPGLAALISVFGLLADPAQVAEQFSTMHSVLPSEAYELVDGQMRDLAARPAGALGAGLAGAILLSVWSATRGTKSLIAALNIAYDERERRGLLRLNLVAFAMTLFLIVLSVVVVALIVALPVALNYVGLGSIAEAAVRWLRWPALAALVLLALAVLYRYGPARRRARWRWVSWGSALAVLVWLVASGLFSIYVSEFGNYNATYGSLGAVIVLLMWLFISGLVVMLGAYVNAETERQTGCDTTHHGVQPRGKRGAYVADHLPDQS
jgi:membrane protein